MNIKDFDKVITIEDIENIDFSNCRIPKFILIQMIENYGPVTKEELVRKEMYLMASMSLEIFGMSVSQTFTDKFLDKIFKDI